MKKIEELFNKVGLTDEAIIAGMAGCLEAKYCCPICRGQHQDHRTVRAAARSLQQLKHDSRVPAEVWEELGLTDERLLTAAECPPDECHGRKMQYSRLDQAPYPSRFNIMGQKMIPEISPQKVNFAIQIISVIS